MRRIIVNIIFTLSMLLMALVLAVGAAVICAVNVLNRVYLTPIVQKYAIKGLDAGVCVCRVEV